MASGMHLFLCRCGNEATFTLPRAERRVFVRSLQAAQPPGSSVGHTGLKNDTAQREDWLGLVLVSSSAEN